MVIVSRKFENFELFCPLGAMKRGVQQKKLLRLIQLTRTPHTYIFFRSRVRVEMGTISEKLCMCVYVALFCWRLFYLISPRSMVTFGSNLVGCCLYMVH